MTAVDASSSAPATSGSSSAPAAAAGTSGSAAAASAAASSSAAGTAPTPALAPDPVSQNLDVGHVVFDLERLLNEPNEKFDLMYFEQHPEVTVCREWVRGVCSRGHLCPFRHPKGDRAVVCKHWLRGLCKKGANCEFLHEYDLSKMPPCHFWVTYNECANPECMYRHVESSDKLIECPWYNRGFCKHGTNCRNRHVRKKLCMNYLQGFCPDGADCEFAHPRWTTPRTDHDMYSNRRSKCSRCGQLGHRTVDCRQTLDPHGRPVVDPTASGRISGGGTGAGGENGHAGMGGRRPLQEVTCYKCGEKGHYANRCSQRVGGAGGSGGGYRQHQGYDNADSMGGGGGGGGGGAYYGSSQGAGSTGGSYVNPAFQQQQQQEQHQQQYHQHHQQQQHQGFGNGGGSYVNPAFHGHQQAYQQPHGANRHDGGAYVNPAFQQQQHYQQQQGYPPQR